MLGRAAVLATVTLLLSSSPADAAPKPLDRIVAVINDDVLCLSEVRARARPFVRQITEQKKRPPIDVELTELHKQLIEQIVDERLIELGAREHHIEVTSEEIDRAVELVAQGAQLTPKALLEEAARTGMTESEYRAELRRQLLNAKWENAVIRPAMLHKSDDAVELVYERLQGLIRLRKRHYVEIRS